MKQIFLFFISLIFVYSAQSQSFEWIKTHGDGGTGIGTIGSSIATDSKGNVIYCVSYPSKCVLFKHDAQGNQVWTKTWTTGVTILNGGYDIVVDNQDNFYVSGWYMETAQIGPYSITSTGGRDIFLAKCDGGGNVDWVRKAGSANSDERIYGIELDKNTGDIYVAGTIDTSKVDLGLNIILTSAGGTDLFLIKYSSGGLVQWAKSYGSSSYDYLYDFTMTASGELFLFGNMGGAATFSSTVSAGRTFIKVDKNGNLSSAGNINIKNAAPYFCAIAGNGDVAIAGDFSDTINIAGKQFISKGGTDIFVAIYDNNLSTAKWANVSGDVNEDVISDLYADKSDNQFYLAGSISNAAYIANLNSFGGFDWQEKTTSTNGSIANAIVANGSVYFSGQFTKDLKFGSVSTPAGNYFREAFGAKYNQSTVGVKENINRNNDVIVYPNPAKNVVNLSGAAANSQKTVLCYNSAGQLVFSKILKPRENSFDVNELQNGLYFLSISTESTISTQKLILNR